MLERFLACYTEISQYIFSTKKHSKTWFTNAHTVVIDLGDGKSFTAILKRFSGSPVTDDILHIDFFQIFDKEITIEVPVKIIGDSKVMAGGDLRLNNRKLKVKALPQNLLILLRLILRHNMGNKLYVTQVLHELQIMHQKQCLSSEDFAVWPLKTQKTPATT
jgi:large subunit ribosomal protein L25